MTQCPGGVWGRKEVVMANERLRNIEKDRTLRIILVDIAACQYLVRDNGAVDPFLSQ